MNIILNLPLLPTVPRTGQVLGSALCCWESIAHNAAESAVSVISLPGPASRAAETSII